MVVREKKRNKTEIAVYGKEVNTTHDSFPRIFVNRGDEVVVVCNHTALRSNASTRMQCIDDKHSMSGRNAKLNPTSLQIGHRRSRALLFLLF